MTYQHLKLNIFKLNLNDHSCPPFPYISEGSIDMQLPQFSYQRFGQLSPVCLLVTFSWLLDKAQRNPFSFFYLVYISQLTATQTLFILMYDDSSHEYNTVLLFFLTKSYLFIKTQCKTTFLVKSLVFKVHMIFYYRMEIAFLGLGENDLMYQRGKRWLCCMCYQGVRF